MEQHFAADSSTSNSDLSRIGESDDNSMYYDIPPEQLRGGTSTRFPFLYDQLLASFAPEEGVNVRPDRSFEEEEEPSQFEILRKMQVPMEQRRRIPGCGINHFARNDTPVRAETSPILLDQLFRPSNKTYPGTRSRQQHMPTTTRRPVQQQRRRVPLIGHSSRILQESESLRREEQQHQRNRDVLSPYIFSCSSSSSSSSSASSSPLIAERKFVKKGM